MSWLKGMKIKNWIFNPIFVISCVLLLAALLLHLTWKNDDYRANAVTEILSIVVTLVFVDNAIKRRDKKILQEKKQRELLRLHTLFNIYLMQYKGAYERIFGKDELKYSDMSKLLKPSPSRFLFSTKPAYHDFFRLWISLRNQAEEYLARLDFGEDDILIDDISIFVADNIFVDTLLVSYQQNEISLLGDKPKIEYDIKMLEEAKEKHEITEIPNTHDVYVYTFELLERNNKFIQVYENLIKERCPNLGKKKDEKRD